MAEIFNLGSYSELRSSVAIPSSEVMKLLFEGSLEQVLKEQVSHQLIKALIKSDLIKLVKIDSPIPNHTQFECRVRIIKEQ